MNQRLAVAVAFGGFLAIAALFSPALAQVVYPPAPTPAQPPVVVCAPCLGRDFGVAGDQGMVLLSGDGNLWFYPLNRTSPVRIGLLTAVGAPIRWVTTP
jgi:hypothetical protein